MPLTLTAINRFPVKSCRGEPLERAAVEPWGLRGDRRWMIVGDDGEAITAREVHRMLLIVPELGEGGLTLTSPDTAPLTVADPDGSTLVPVSVWGTPVRAAPAGPVADAWVSAVVGMPARLVYLDDPTRRPTNPLRTKASDRVSFADGYPLLLTTEESLTALNDYIAEGALAHEGPLPMIRFRPSVVVRGAPAWDEDRWRRVRIGAVEFRAVKGCDRCVLTTIDPDTALGGKEPIASLARHRRWDGRTWFGVNLVPDAQGGDAGAPLRDICVGDEVDVLSAVESADGPLR